MYTPFNVGINERSQTTHKREFCVSCDHNFGFFPSSPVIDIVSFCCRLVDIAANHWCFFYVCLTLRFTAGFFELTLDLAVMSCVLTSQLPYETATIVVSSFCGSNLPTLFSLFYFHATMLGSTPKLKLSVCVIPRQNKAFNPSNRRKAWECYIYPVISSVVRKIFIPQL